MSQSSPEVTEFLNHDSDVKTPKKITKTGWALLGVSGALFVGVYAVTAPFVSPALRKICLPYVPATTRQVKNVMTMLQGRTGRLVDLGSGDGRIVCNHLQSVQLHLILGELDLKVHHDLGPSPRLESRKSWNQGLS